LHGLQRITDGGKAVSGLAYGKWAQFLCHTMLINIAYHKNDWYTVIEQSETLIKQSGSWLFYLFEF